MTYVETMLGGYLPWAYTVLFFVSLGANAAIIIIFRRLSKLGRCLDDLTAVQSMHLAPTPRVGALAFVAGILALYPLALVIDVNVKKSINFPELPDTRRCNRADGGPGVPRQPASAAGGLRALRGAGGVFLWARNRSERHCTTRCGPRHHTARHHYGKLRAECFCTIWNCELLQRKNFRDYLRSRAQHSKAFFDLTQALDP